MTAIPTAAGRDVDSANLGFTLTHEHVFNASIEINLNYPETWGDEEANVARAITDLRRAKEHGVDSLVDVTVIGLGRYIPRVQRVAEAVDVNIVVATGFYTWNDLPMYFAFTGPGTELGGPEKMDSMFRRDIEDGIADTGVRAAIIKCATHSPGVTEGIDRVLRACARTHRATGVPITTHTRRAPNGLEQQKIFREEGVDLSRVVIGHLDRELFAGNWAYVEEIIEAGSMIGIDSFGLEWVPDGDQVRLDCVAELCRRGYVEHILLSHDRPSTCDFLPQDWLADGEDSTFPDWNLTTVSDKAVPGLIERGVDPKDIETMTRVNPRRMLESTSLGTY